MGVIEFKNGENIEIYQINDKSGANTGDLIYDFNEKKFHPVYRLGNTNICFEENTQNNIYKVLGSSNPKHNLPLIQQLTHKNKV